MTTLSLRFRVVCWLLRLTRRKRIYASERGLLEGIAAARRRGPAMPTASMRARLDIEESSVEGRPVFTVRPRQSPSERGQVLYLHGGAYVRPITRQHWQLVEHVACATGRTVIVPLYPLAPESQGLAALEFVRSIYLDAQRQQDDRAITFMGDSAGAGLCVSLALALRDSGQPVPAKLILVTPWAGLALDEPELPTTTPMDPMLAPDGLRVAARLYLGEQGSDHRWLNPLLADLHGLPPMVVFAGTHDISHHGAVRLVERAQAHACQAQLILKERMIHVWPLLPFPEGERARARIVELLR